MKTTSLFSAALASVLGLTWVKLAQADRFICRVDSVRVLETKGNPGSEEEWDVRRGAVYFGSNTRSKELGMMYKDFSIKNLNNKACEPPDNKKKEDGFYTCPVYAGNSRAGANWCVDDAKSFFKFGFKFQIGDYDAGFDNGPSWDVGRQAIRVNKADLPTKRGGEWSKYYTRTGPEGRKGRIFAKCWREAGSCKAIGYKHHGNGGGYSNFEGRGYKQGCSVFAQCREGLSCHPGVHECYNNPRKYDEPCSLFLAARMACLVILVSTSAFIHHVLRCEDGLTCVIGQRCVPDCLDPAIDALRDEFDLDELLDKVKAKIDLDNEPEEAVADGTIKDSFQKPLEAFVDAYKSCGQQHAAATFYAGLVGEFGAGAKHIGVVALAVDTNGNLGAAFVDCTSVGANFGAAVGFVLGIVFTPDIQNLPGKSNGFDFDVHIGPGISIAFQFALDGTPAIEVGLGAGVNVNVFSGTHCDTAVKPINY
ncbi:expressed unknown protein [Seminavis robusta]|uniref:Uncharacterized protein n=1 Tax=Seminavis robusta TaxID=568900 RepID=A0A9N8H539_9STRA|nr:expressed unknown protein [Seminavis robusta]|eukprot:Sro65_g036660.1 n/a (478) ;mRNA; f:42250-43881